MEGGGGDVKIEHGLKQATHQYRDSQVILGCCRQACNELEGAGVAGGFQLMCKDI